MDHENEIAAICQQMLSLEKSMENWKYNWIGWMSFSIPWEDFLLIKIDFLRSRGSSQRTPEGRRTWMDWLSSQRE